MVDIKPFKGILYNDKKVENLSYVVAPPYDVISSLEQEALYKLSDFNVVRLILGKDDPNDNPKDNRYTRAAHFTKKWLQNGILKQDANPSIYVYQQEYKLRTGKTVKRTGYVALVKLEPLQDGHIRPHEKTLSQPKQDRFNLLKETRASFCQIFSLYSDPKSEIDAILSKITEAQPDLEARDADSVLHRIWKISKPEIIGIITDIMKDKTLYIADGHHRYETALRYQEEMKKATAKHASNECFNYAMMTLVDMNSQELSVLPIHRVLRNLRKTDVERLAENLALYFHIERFTFDEETELDQRMAFFEEMSSKGEKEHVFGMYSGDSQYHLLTLKNERVLDEVLKRKGAETWKKLDVAILHSLIIDYLLHVKSTDSQIQAHIEHIKDGDEAIDLVNSQKYQIAFFLNPTKVSQVKDISSQGEVLPQKSTFFYPKLLSGLVMFKLD